MRFDDLDKRLRQYETAYDFCVPQENFNELPAWQKRGFGVYFQTTLKEGFNPQTKENVQVERQILHTDFELPLGDGYGAFVLERIV